MGLATLYCLASLRIIHGPMPRKFIFESLRWLMPGRDIMASIFCIQFWPVIRRPSLTNVWRPQNVTNTLVGMAIAPAVDARIIAAQVFSRSPL